MFNLRVCIRCGEEFDLIGPGNTDFCTDECMYAGPLTTEEMEERAHHSPRCID